MEFSIAGAEIAAVNGSSVISHCSNIEDGRITCLDPQDTVVFDGIIPTLTALSTDTSWAKELLTLSVIRQQPIRNNVVIQLNFTTGEMYSNDLWHIEIVHFNCPQWDIYIDAEFTIYILEPNDMGSFSVILPPLVTVNTSCDSLLNATVSFNSSSSIFRLVLYKTETHWLHIAEIATYRYTELPTELPTFPPTTDMENTVTTPSYDEPVLNLETIIISGVIATITIVMLCVTIGIQCILVSYCLKKQSHNSHCLSMPSATAPPPLSMPSATAAPPLSMHSATAAPPLSMPSETAAPPLSMPSATALPPLSMPSATVATPNPNQVNERGRKHDKDVDSVKNQHYAHIQSTTQV